MSVEHLIPIEPFLPHRQPMLMVDHILEIGADRVRCKFEVLKSCIFVVDSALQEAGILENMAQTCSSIIGQTYFDDLNNPKDKKAIGFISAIKNMTIFSLPAVGTVLYTDALLENKFQGEDYTLSTMLVNTMVDDQVIATGIINLFLQEEQS